MTNTLQTTCKTGIQNEGWRLCWSFASLFSFTWLPLRFFRAKAVVTELSQKGAKIQNY